jgi:hypothetical protein
LDPAKKGLMTRRLLWFGLIAVLLLVAFAGGWISGRLGIGPTVDPASLTDLERQFADRMSNSSLVGSFTIAGSENRQPRADRYDISSVEKIGDNLWRFNARMRHDSFDVTLPVAVPLRWIGDTPVIMMTDTTIPGLGTFTVRLFFYGDRYSGSWQHGSVGGHMYGRIEKQQAAIE